jgi:hypothetical protein
MSHASRFALNLNVVRRRDPSIVRIFDQFNHVTVYHHNYEAGKWEKHGYEGAMFLFERRVPEPVRAPSCARVHPPARLLTPAFAYSGTASIGTGSTFSTAAASRTSCRRCTHGTT